MRGKGISYDTGFLPGSHAAVRVVRPAAEAMANLSADRPRR
jgi:hypothetical protein